MSCSFCNSTRKRGEGRDNTWNNTGWLNSWSMKFQLASLSTVFKNRKVIGNLSKISASIVVNAEQWSILITLEMPSFGLHFQEHFWIVLLELFQRTGITFSLFMHFDSKSKTQSFWGYKAVPIFKPKWPISIRDYFLHASLQDSDVSHRLKKTQKNQAFLQWIETSVLRYSACPGKNILWKVIWFSYTGREGS